MNYFTKNGDKVKCDQTKLLGTGTRGKVYLTKKQECIKIWANKSEIPFEGNLFDELTNLQLPNYYVLLSLLFKRKQDINNPNLAAGYLYQWVEQEPTDILTMPVSYTLDNLNELLKANEILTRNNIMVDDLHCTDNVILNQNSITAIDIDLYTKNHFLNSRELRDTNITELEELFKGIYLESIRKYHQELDTPKTKVLIKSRELFELNYREGVSYTSKKLSRYKYPIDYFKHSNNL